MPPYTTESMESGGRREVTATAAFVLLALVVLYLPPAEQQRIASALRSTVLRPFVVTQEELVRARARATEARRLRAALDSQVARSTAQTHLAEENRRLRGLLSLHARIAPAYRAATVIRPGTAGSESIFVLDVGESDDVVPDAPVITRHGLVGRVHSLRRSTAMGIDWTHPDFRASAMTLDGTAFGLVSSVRGRFREEDRLMLTGTPFHSTLDPGTIVVTSGLGGVFPRGIPVGRVVGLAEADAGWRKSYWLEAFVRPGEVVHVLVATNGADTVPGDLRAAWPPDSILTASELASLGRARRDSVEAVADSLRMLREILDRRGGAAAPPDPTRRAGPDSAGEPPGVRGGRG